MKSITIRDLRQRWPAAEAALAIENEILVTRDSKPVAKLVAIKERPPSRPRWNMEDHAKWQKKVAGGKLSRSDRALTRSRADRPLRAKTR